MVDMISIEFFIFLAFGYWLLANSVFYCSFIIVKQVAPTALNYSIHIFATNRTSLRDSLVVYLSSNCYKQVAPTALNVCFLSSTSTNRTSLRDSLYLFINILSLPYCHFLRDFVIKTKWYFNSFLDVMAFY